MNIQTVVIHEIKKREAETNADVFLTDEVLDSANPRIVNIVSSLDASFSKKTLRRAKFSDDGFKTVISDFENIDLVDSSRKLVEKLKDGIQNIPAAKGGYLVFCQYMKTVRYLSVFLVRNTEGSRLREMGNQKWDITSIMYLDVEHFAMGVRINLDLLDSDDRYLQLVKGNTDISDYFENWVGLKDRTHETKDGEALYELINNIDLPDYIGNRDDLKKNVFDYVSNKPSKTVNLRELSQHLYDDEDKISAYCDENNIDIDGEFKLRREQLNKFYKVSISAGGIKLEAPRSNFSQAGISVSEDGETVLIRSRELADEIKKNVN